MILRSILELDARLSDRLRVAEQPGLLRTLAVFFAHSGDSWFWGLGLLLLWWLGDSFWRQWSLILFAGIAVMAVIVMTIKFTVRRRRPEGEWGGIYRATDPHSFPSGHAARCFLIAVLVIGLGPAWLAILLCVWAPLVSLARVAMGVHYVSDVVVGALLGTIVGLLWMQAEPFFLSWLANTVNLAL
jgi:membrane-associated phospholipid phosphatase